MALSGAMHFGRLWHGALGFAEIESDAIGCIADMALVGNSDAFDPPLPSGPSHCDCKRKFRRGCGAFHAVIKFVPSANVAESHYSLGLANSGALLDAQ
jgi:hypothetical protein